ncbi:MULTISPECIES: phosphotransferase [Brucella/Ochrobactrum group]|uniref:phosphotransferase n=1 Tax=Brucella/Ochrobactrum group TaxID=2826938 RepID=UPI001F0A5ACB|nr:phosphotransferase [Brucella tritici]MCH4543806.1 phosphotransferase [Ochrobactrum sp. A-1]
MKTAGVPQTPLEIRVETALRSFRAFLPKQPTYKPATAPVASPSYHAVESDNFDIVLQDARPDYFLRLGIDEVSEFVDDDVAFAAAVRLHALGLSPEPVARDAATRSTLFTRLGEGWRAAKIDDLMGEVPAAKLVEMQKLIARGPAFSRSWSVFEDIDVLWNIVVKAGASLPDDAEWMLAWMNSIREAVEASGVDLKPAHGDPHSSNVMLGPDGAIQLVDFDMAGDMDPYYQLGVQMNELYQFEGHMKPLLEMHDGVFDERMFNRCRVYAAADDLYWALRSLLLEMRSPRRSVEFLKYTGWRFLRCRMLLGHPDFEGRLRSV